MNKGTLLSILVVFTVLFFHPQAYAQAHCTTPEFEGNANDEHLFNDYVLRFKARHGDVNTNLKTIPLVIHVIYRNTEDSLQASLSRILEQIEATNKQLRRLNANAVETNPIFVPVAADCDLQVCLATKKPDGKKFGGIIYHKYPNYDQLRDYDAVVAATILAPSKYLNVWVCPGVEGGSAIFPWARSASVDGFWVGIEWFGVTGSNLSHYMQGGSTFTHELAHYLGVYHTFHTSGQYLTHCERVNDPTIGDLCEDTPLDWDESFIDAHQCKSNIRFCETPPGVSQIITQTENYMYYNKDSCVNMFSKDQRARMRACVDSVRGELVSRSNLYATGVNCVSIPVDSPDLERKIYIFPNPTRDLIHIVYNDLDISYMNIRVYNQSGRKIKDVRSNKEIRQLNLGLYPDGLYYIKITINDEASITRRILKK